MSVRRGCRPLQSVCVLREEGQRRHSHRNQPGVIYEASPEGQQVETGSKNWPEAQRINKGLGRENKQHR